jgi:hypothetical protein
LRSAERGIEARLLLALPAFGNVLDGADEAHDPSLAPRALKTSELPGSPPSEPRRLPVGAGTGSGSAPVGLDRARS